MNKYIINPWKIIQKQYDSEQEAKDQSVYTLANGYLGFRGCFEEGCAGNGVDGTYLNGFYDSETIKYGEIAYGYAKESQTMLNIMNAKSIKLFIEEEEFSLASGSILNYEYILDLKAGITTRKLLWESMAGKRLELNITRLVSLSDYHTAGIEYQVIPVNFTGEIRIRSVIDGNVTNLKCSDDPRVGSGLKEDVLAVTNCRAELLRASMEQKTKKSGLYAGAAVIHSIKTENNYEVKTVLEPKLSGCEILVAARQGIPVTLEKRIAYIKGNHDGLIEEAESIAEGMPDFKTMRVNQMEYLEEFWNGCGVEIEGDDELLQGLRFNMFQLLQSAGKDGRSNISAKGLTGEGYEGHYFWDTETYILPMFLHCKPEVAKELLMFRYHQLPFARERAREMAHIKGALYPWRTIHGEECSAYYPAGTAQYHINADIAFAVKRYIECTADIDFLKKFGAEILVETARLWYDLGFFNGEKDGAFCINGVTGPDEYNAIVNNNCYTNLMAAENMRYALTVCRILQEQEPESFKELKDKVGLKEEELTNWEMAADKIYLPYDEKRRLYLQDDEFLSRIPWDLSTIPKENFPLLLHYHPLVIYRHMVCKQADVVLALFLLGECFTLEQKRIAFDFYDRVTTHDSSLSMAIFSVIAEEIGYEGKAYDYFRGTARLDLDDMHNNTKDGLHMANMAGTWIGMVNGFAGMRIKNGILHFQPRLPKQFQGYSVRLNYKSRIVELSVKENRKQVRLLKGEDLTVYVDGEPVNLSMKAKQYKGIIFDLDGVICSTDHFHFLAWKTVADKLGIYFDQKINNRLRGVSRMESLEIILEQYSEHLTENEKITLAEEKNEVYKELLKQMSLTDLSDEVKNTLKILQSKNIKLAIGSSSKNTRFILERIGLKDFFDAVSDGNNITKSKPDPEVFIKAAEMLGLDNRDCLVVEDARAGIEAAIAGEFDSAAIGDAVQFKKASYDLGEFSDLLRIIR